MVGLVIGMAGGIKEVGGVLRLVERAEDGK